MGRLFLINRVTPGGEMTIKCSKTLLIPEIVLLTCPFCGADKSVIKRCDSASHEVKCETCFRYGPFGKSAEEAAEKWNDMDRELFPKNSHDRKLRGTWT